MNDDRPALTLTEAAKATKVSRKTLRRRLDSDEFPNARRLDGPTGTGTGPWVVPIADLLSAGFTLHSPNDDPPTLTEPNETVARIVEFELRAEWHGQELARVKAERDQARNDVEYERGELARSQADIVQGRIERGRLEAQAEAVQAIADERQARIEALDAHAQELLERADTTADELRDALNNVTRRYRRKLRKAQAAQTPLLP